MRRLALLLALTVFSATARAATADRFLDRVAKRVARGCVKGRVHGLVVGPVRGKSDAVDRELSERLVAKLVRVKGLPALTLRSDKPDAAVVVWHKAAGNELEIGVKMVDEDGLVLYSDSARVPNEWTRGAAAPLKTAGNCADASLEIDVLQRSILDLKARYWAARLRRGPSEAESRLRPGEMISDRQLAADFESSLRRWMAAKRVPGLSRQEVRAFLDADSESYRLFEECRQRSTVADASKYF